MAQTRDLSTKSGIKLLKSAQVLGIYVNIRVVIVKTSRIQADRVHGRAPH